jgi:hypothetical protein
MSATAGHFLQTVIAHGGGCAQAFFDIPLFEYLPLLMRMVSPNTGVTIGL